MLFDLQPEFIIQGELDLGDDGSLEDIADKARLMSALGALNNRHGRGIFSALKGYRLSDLSGTKDANLFSSTEVHSPSTVLGLHLNVRRAKL